MLKRILKPTLLKRVIATLLIALAVVWVALMAYYYWVETSAHSSANRQLERGNIVKAELAKIDNISQAIQAASLFSSMFNTIYVKADLPIRYVVLLENRAGDRLFSSLATDNIRFTELKNEISVSVIDGTKYTVYRGVMGNLVVFLGEPASPPLWLLTRISSNLTISVLISLPLLLLPIWFAVSRGLSPLRNFSNNISKRGPDDLEPLELNVKYSELEPLVNALNRLFSQLRAKVAREKSFVQDAAHELRTPIAVISAQAHVMSMASNQEDRTQAAKYLESAISRVSHLIEQLLTSARIDSCDLKTLTLLDVAQLLRQELANATQLAMRRNIELSLESPDIVTARIDATPLQSIFQNLLSNAIRYGRQDGIVVVELRTEGNLMTITVADDGPGIAETEREMVFERFYRVAGTDIPGSGLGLAIVSQAVSRLHGSLSLENGLRGCGCKFTIQLPLKHN